MIGIYKITNKINGQAYIGQSVNIEHRLKDHFKRAFQDSIEKEKALYRAIRKYGKEAFSTEILEECLKEELNEKEIFYIEKFDTYKNGYNETPGGDTFGDHHGELHPKTKLTNEDVYYIRECYNNHLSKDEVYKKFEHLIGESGFKKIWNGYSWQEIHMDVYTPENKAYFLYKRNSQSEHNAHAKLTENDVRNIRLRKKQGEVMKDVWKDYQQVTLGTFKNIWCGWSWKNVIV